MQEDNGT